MSMTRTTRIVLLLSTADLLSVLPTQAAMTPGRDFCANPLLAEPRAKLPTCKHYQKWRPIARGDLPTLPQRIWRRRLVLAEGPR